MLWYVQMYVYLPLRIDSTEQHPLHCTTEYNNLVKFLTIPSELHVAKTCNFWSEICVQKNIRDQIIAASMMVTVKYTCGNQTYVES